MFKFFLAFKFKVLPFSNIKMATVWNFMIWPACRIRVFIFIINFCSLYVTPMQSKQANSKENFNNFSRYKGYDIFL